MPERIWFRRALAIVVASTVTAGLLASAIPAEADYAPGPILNPDKTHQTATYPAYAYADTLIKALDGTPKGSTVRGIMYLLDLPDVGAAVERAHKRGVTVRLVVDHGAPGPVVARLKKVLGTNRKARSFLYQPTRSGLSDSPAASVHAKSWQFSQTKMDGHTYYWRSIVGSGNPATTNTLGSWNENQMLDSKTLYTGLRVYFDDIARDVTRSHYNKKVTSGSVTLQMAPGMTNVIGARLNSIPATTAGCKEVEIRAAEFQWTIGRLAEAKRLATLAARGCKVYVTINVVPDGHLVDATVMRTFLASKVQVRNGRKANHGYVHLKTVLIKTPTSTTVYSGSQNMTAKRQNADILVTNTSAATYGAYAAFYSQLWATAVPVVKFPTRTPQKAGDDADEIPMD